MAQRIFITATNTDIGKTYTTEALLRHYAAQGYRIGAFKPIETGVSDTPLDGSKLLNTLKALNPEFSAVSVNDIVPIQFTLPAAPYVANQANPIDTNALLKALEKIEGLCDILLIEGAGGLLVPVDPSHHIIDLITLFHAKTLLVSHCRLGCINDTLLNLAALEAAGLAYEWILNCRSNDDTFATVSRPYFMDRFGDAYTLQEHLEIIAARLLN